MALTLRYLDCDGREVQRLHSQPADPFAPLQKGHRTVPPVLIVLPERPPKWLRRASLEAAAREARETAQENPCG